MKFENISERFPVNKKFLPVVMPLALLVLATSSFGVYNRVASMPKAGSKTAALEYGYNSTESAFLDYANVSQMLDRNEDAAALSRIRQLSRVPLEMDGDTFHAASLSMFSPKTLLLSLSQRLGKRAHAVAQDGNYALAQEYIDALYSIGNHVLETSNPTLNGLEIAHHFHGFAARLQSNVLAKENYPVNAAQYRQRALSTFWQMKISPQLDPASTLAEPSKNRQLALRLSQEYRDGWSRICAGEV